MKFTLLTMSQIAHFPTPSPPSLLPSSGFRPAGLLWVSQRRSLVPTQGCLPTVFPWPRMPSPHSGQLLLWAPYLCYFLSEVFPPCRLTSNRVPFIFLFFFAFLRHTCTHGGSQDRGPISVGCWPTAQQCGICDLHHGSWQCQIFNPRERPGIKPTFSWTLSRFLTC